jgi:hypothetical protein
MAHEDVLIPLLIAKNNNTKRIKIKTLLKKM